MRLAYLLVLFCACEEPISSNPGFTATIGNIDGNPGLSSFTAMMFGAGVIGGYSDAVAIRTDDPCPEIDMFFVGKLSVRDYTITGTAQSIQTSDTDPTHAYIDYQETCPGKFTRKWLPVGGGTIHVSAASSSRVELSFTSIPLQAPCGMGDTVCQNRQGGNSAYGNVTLSGSGNTVTTSGL